MDALYKKLEDAIEKSNKTYDLSRIESAYELAKKAHEGQIRSSGDPYISHPIEVAIILVGLGMDSDTIISGLLHDVVEDTDTAINELPVNEKTKEIVNLLTFKLLPNMSKEESKKIYYQNIAKNKKAVTVKILDRCNNISTMAYVFSKEKIIEYINETEEYIIPLISVLKSEPAPYCNIAFIIKYHIISVLEAIKPFI